MATRGRLRARRGRNPPDGPGSTALGDVFLQEDDAKYGRRGDRPRRGEDASKRPPKPTRSRTARPDPALAQAPGNPLGELGRDSRRPLGGHGSAQDLQVLDKSTACGARAQMRFGQLRLTGVELVVEPARDQVHRMFWVVRNHDVRPSTHSRREMRARASLERTVPSARPSASAIST